jgi:hypothetical protein
VGVAGYRLTGQSILTIDPVSPEFGSEAVNKNTLIPYLSKKYSIPESLLKKRIHVEERLTDIIPASARYDLLRRKGEEALGMGRRRGGAEAASAGINHPGMAHLHYPVYEERVVLGKSSPYSNAEGTYGIEDFIVLFPKLTLFVVPLYGIHEVGENQAVQQEIKKFAVAFGRKTGKELLVFDYWTADEFDYEQYERLESHIMDKLGISQSKLPAILISNRSPYAWEETDEDKRMVVLSFRNFPPSELGKSLRKLREDLRYLRMPSKWGHDWKRFIAWAHRRNVVGTATGVL